MRRIHSTRIPVPAVLLVSAMLTAASCAESSLDPIHPGSGDDSSREMQEVKIHVGGLATRTMIDSDEGGSEAGQGVSFRWTGGDVISLWAQGATSFGHVLFTHEEHPDDPDGTLFSGTVPVMEEDDYIYYAVYPGDKVEVQGTSLRIPLPTVQSGEYDPALDIMRAESAGSRLTANRTNRTGLRFRHLTHILKIRVPEVPFGSGKIARMRIDFPVAVTGTLVFEDIAAESPVLEDGSDAITLEFTEPKAAGEDIWAFIAPVDVTDAEVTFTATDGTDFTYPSVTSAFRNLAAGHITPVNVGFRVRELADELFTITVDRTNLGEDVTALHAFTLPEGYVFPGLGTPDTAGAESFIPLGEGRFGIRLYKDIAQIIPEVEGMSATFRAESEHTVPQDWTSEMTDVSTAGLTVSSPYVFFEDFSQVGTFSKNDGEGTDLTADDLGGNGLEGWTAARYGVDAGTSLRINCRTTYALFGGVTRYHGRADSRPMTGLKEDVAIKVKVSFDYSLGRDNSSMTPMMAYGCHTSPGKINAASGNSTALTAPVAKDIRSGSGNNGSWTNVNESAAFEIEECTSGHRLVWECYNSGSSFSSTNSWLYIDNIKVSIAE